jgi:hypothetical protein
MRAGQEAGAAPVTRPSVGPIQLPGLGSKDEAPTLEQLQERARRRLARDDAGS